MGKRLIKSAITNRKITIFLVIIIMLFGSYSYYFMPKQEDPDIQAPVAMIITAYPGASAEEVEKTVTQKIEEYLVTIEGYGYTNSYSNNNVSTILLRMDYGTDIDEAWSDLRLKMGQLQSELPEGCQEIEINTNIMDTAGMILAVSGDRYSLEELNEYTQTIKRELEKIQGMSRLNIDGVDEKEINVIINEEKLNSTALSLENVIDIIKAQNIKIPSGRVNEGEEKFNVNILSKFVSVRDIEDIIININSQDGSITRLKDIADIKIDSKESNLQIKYNDNKTILLTGYFKSDENIVSIGDEVSEEIELIKKMLPEDVSVNKVVYQPKEVSESVNKFLLNLVQGVLFVIIVVLLGMGYRNAVIVSTAIPISIFITLSAMNLLQIKVHQISIAALIVALGMLVDNAIVISDAIQNKINEYDDKLKACVDGVREVAMPVFTSTLTTCAAFLPLLFLSSIAGEYISSIPKIVIISLFASYLVAVLVIPTMAYIFFKKKEINNKKYRLRRLFKGLLTNSIKRPKITVLFIIIIIIVTGFIVADLGLQFFPKADKNILYIDVKADKNIDINYTAKVVEDITAILKAEPEIISYTAVTGGGLPKFYNSMPNTINSINIGQILLEIDLNKSDRFTNNNQITDCLQEKLDIEITKGEVSVKQLEIAEPIGSPVRVRLTGENIEDLKMVKEDIKEVLKDVPGTTNIKDDFSVEKEEFEIKIDKDKAGSFGLSMYDIQNEINIALMGKKASVFKANEEMNIIVKSDINTIDELKNLRIKSDVSSQKVVLSDISEVNIKSKITLIRKYDREYAVMVTSDVKEGFNPVTVQNDLNDKIKDLDLKDVDITFDGEREKIQENFGNIGTLAVLAVVLIYVILLFQFKFFIQPLIILLTIPLSAVGSILGIYFLNQPLSFTAVFGMVSLMGIVVNNAIVLIDYINFGVNEGKSVKEACLIATDQRFRPIILSSITTIMGLTPLVFSGSELFRPMAISLMSGLMVSTLLTLVIVPLTYCLVYKERNT